MPIVDGIYNISSILIMFYIKSKYLHMRVVLDHPDFRLRDLKLHPGKCFQSPQLSMFIQPMKILLREIRALVHKCVLSVNHGWFLIQPYTTDLLI